MEMRTTARVSLSHFACFVCVFFALFCFVSLMRKLRDNLPLQINVQKSNFIGQPEFYLGYLRVRSFPTPPNAQLPRLKKYFYHWQYISNSIGKIIQTQQGQCTHCTISQNCVSKCTRLHRSAYSFQKNFPGEHAPRPPLGSSWPSPTRDFSQKREILHNQAKKARSFVTASNNVGTRVRVLPLYLFTDVLPTTRLANNLFPTS